MGGEQLPRASKYQRVGSCLLLPRANPYFRALFADKNPEKHLFISHHWFSDSWCTSWTWSNSEAILIQCRNDEINVLSRLLIFVIYLCRNCPRLRIGITGPQ
jgi:hypothetical protein